ncbi:MAG: tetratricopeptide repeat protein [Deltaproteobacteria bacterium]|nr:tetratricopeptide repeat protein [Deltaproteobacteria bacterium]
MYQTADTMRLFRIFLSYLFLFALIACAGGKAAHDRPDPAEPAVNELGRGIGWYEQGCYHKALDHLLRAHELFTAIDEVPGVAACLNNIGNVYAKIGDPESAMLFFDASHDLYGDLGDDGGAVQVMANKAALLIRENRQHEAQATLAAAEETADRNGITSVSLLKSRGMLMAAQQKTAEAERLFGEALEAADPESYATTGALHYALGNVMAETGRYDEGIAHYRKALDADRKTGFHSGIADDLSALGTLYQKRGEHAAASACFQRSIKIYALMGDGEKVTQSLEKLEVSVGEAGVDTAVTKHFVNRWLNGNIRTSLCQ